MWAWPVASTRWALALAGRGEDAGQRGPRVGGRAGDVARVEGVHRCVQGDDDLRPPRQVGRELLDQAGQHLDVLVELPDLEVAPGDVEAAQHVERLVRDGVLRAERRRVPGAADGHLGVGGALEVEVDVARVLHRQVAVERLDRLDDGAVGPEGEPLGLAAVQVLAEAEVDDDLVVVLVQPSRWARRR